MSAEQPLSQPIDLEFTLEQAKAEFNHHNNIHTCFEQYLETAESTINCKYHKQVYYEGPFQDGQVCFICTRDDAEDYFVKVNVKIVNNVLIKQELEVEEKAAVAICYDCLVEDYQPCTAISTDINSRATSDLLTVTFKQFEFPTYCCRNWVRISKKRALFPDRPEDVPAKKRKQFE